MVKLFNLFAGTSTGSLIAASLVTPDPSDPTKNKFWAQDVIEVFTKEGVVVFTEASLSKTSHFWAVFITSLFGAGLGYLVGRAIFVNPKYEKKI